ncbi:MAG: glycosyltransferase family 1 protein [Chloroflexi bacterium]|nr:glycosyltransferase family 1 protein [Chloroflexota bacterium]
MSRILFITYPAYGHVAPALAVADVLLAQGHQIAWVTGGQVEYVTQELQMTGIQVYLSSSFDLSPELVRDAEQGKNITVELFFNPARIQCEVEDGRHAINDFRPEVIVTDETHGAKIVAELAQLPWAQILINSLTIPGVKISNRSWIKPSRLKLALLNLALWMVMKYGHRYNYAINHVRKKYGLPPLDSSGVQSVLSPQLNIIPSIPEFEQILLKENCQNIYFVGELLRDRVLGAPSLPWLEEFTKRHPVVYVTQGTSLKRPELFKMALQAFIQLDVQVVMTTGFQMNRDVLLASPIPSNVRIEQWISHQDILPFTDAMVFPGGFSSSIGALFHGVPQV